MKVTKGIQQNNGIMYEVVSNGTTDSASAKTLELLIKYGIKIQDEKGQNIKELSGIRVENAAPQQVTPEKVLKRINIDEIKANCKSYYPDWETVKPGDWSKNTKKFEDDVEVGLYREPLDEDADIAGTFTLQAFWGDDVIYCETVADLVLDETKAVLKKIDIDGIKANCKQQFPDWETLKPGSWSNHAKNFENDSIFKGFKVEVNLYREPLDTDEDKAGTYTLMTFWGDDLIYDETVADLVPAKKEPEVRSTADLLKNIADTAPVEEEEEIDFSSVFTNLGLDKAKQLIQEKIDSGMSDEDAFNEVFQMEQDLGDIGVEEEEEEIDLYDEEEEIEEEEIEESEDEESMDNEDSEEDISNSDEEDVIDESGDEEDIVEDEYDEEDLDEDTQTSLMILDSKAALLKELESLPYFTTSQAIKDKKAKLLKEIEECDKDIDAFGVDEYIDDSETTTSNTWRVGLEIDLENEYKNNGDEKAHERLHVLQAQPYNEMDNKVARLYDLVKANDTDGNHSFDLIQQYFLWYSRRVFNRESKKVVRNNVPLYKRIKLDAVKAKSSNWAYAGFIDTGRRGNGHCFMGHALRFVHYIWDLNESDIENFFFSGQRASQGSIEDVLNAHGKKDGENYYRIGATCAGDFFELDEDFLNLFGITQKAVLSGFEELCDIYESGMAPKVMQYFDELDKIVAETQGHHAMLQILFDESEANYEKSEDFICNPRLEYFYTEFRAAGICPPKTMIMELRDSYAYGTAFYYWKSIKNRNWWARTKQDVIMSMVTLKTKGAYKNINGMFSYTYNRDLMYKLLEILTGFKLQVRELPTPIDEYLNIYYLFRLAGLYMYGPRDKNFIPKDGISLIDAFRSLEESGKDSTRGRGSEKDYDIFCYTLREAPFMDSSKNSYSSLGIWNGEETDVFMPQILESKGYTLEYVKTVYTIYCMESQIEEALHKLGSADYAKLLKDNDWLDELNIENGEVSDENVVVPMKTFDSESIKEFGNTDFLHAAMLLYWVNRSIGSKMHKYSIEFAISKELLEPKKEISETKVVFDKITYREHEDKIRHYYNMEDCFDAMSILPEIKSAIDIVNNNADAYTNFVENNSTAKAEVQKMIDTVSSFYKAVDNRVATDTDGTDLTAVDDTYAKAVTLDTQIMDDYTVYIKKSGDRLLIAVGKANLSEYEFHTLKYVDLELQDTFYIDKLKDLFKKDEPQPIEEEPTPISNPAPTASATTTPITPVLAASTPATTPAELMQVLNTSDLSGISVNVWARDSLLADIQKRGTKPENLSAKQLIYLGKLYKELTGNDYGGAGISNSKTKLSQAEENAINYALQNKTAFIAQYDDRTADIISTVLRYKEYSEKQGKYVQKAVDFEQSNAS